MTQPKLHVRTGDQVQVLAGRNRGRKGKVLKVDPAKATALVEGVNLIKKAVRPTEANPEGGITEREAPLHVSKLKVLESVRKEAE
jgi:large subunit ribosomal protein L24